MLLLVMFQSYAKSVGLCLFVSAMIIGCSGRPGRISTPGVNASDAAQEALQLYDKNSDGQLNAEELVASPPLLNALSAYDADKNDSLSQAELVAGMESWSQRGIGAMSLPFTVRLDGRPLEGAQVKLVPAPFMGGSIQPASGVADNLGAGSLEIANENRPSGFPKNLPVMQPGLYLVEITHPTTPVPEVYNTSTTLGLEAGLAGQNPSGVTWDLQSKKK